MKTDGWFATLAIPTTSPFTDLTPNVSRLMPATACSWRNNRRLLSLHRSTTLSHLFHLNRGECLYLGFDFLSDTAGTCSFWHNWVGYMSSHLLITYAGVAMCVRVILIKQPLIVLLLLLSTLVGFIHPNYRYVQNHEWLLVYVGYVTVWIRYLFPQSEQDLLDSRHTICLVLFTF